MTAWIKNVSMADVQHGHHPNSDGVMLIQIVDPDMEFPQPMRDFKEVHQFRFLDLEQHHQPGEQFKITDQQATDLVNLLQRALDSGTPVLVHCVAGVCRSGAVCEVGVIMGFQDTGAHRQPNLLVKRKMLRALGLSYDSDPDENNSTGPLT